MEKTSQYYICSSIAFSFRDLINSESHKLTSKKMNSPSTYSALTSLPIPVPHFLLLECNYHLIVWPSSYSIYLKTIHLFPQITNGFTISFSLPKFFSHSKKSFSQVHSSLLLAKTKSCQGFCYSICCISPNPSFHWWHASLALNASCMDCFHSLLKSPQYFLPPILLKEELLYKKITQKDYERDNTKLLTG